MPVTRIEEIGDERGELGVERGISEVMENRRFTDTELPVLSGGEGWYQHISHCASHSKIEWLAGRNCGVAVVCASKRRGVRCGSFVKKKVRESWTGLVQGLAAYYQSPGRLAGLRRQFADAFRHPGLDPATSATDLGMLAIQGFADMREQARDTMIRDKFIAGQEQCALRRQLDGFAQDTPIGEIVDSCRVWESHSDSDRIAGKRVELETDNQSGDSRTWERNRVTVVVDNREPEREAREEVSDSQGIEVVEELMGFL